MANIENRNWPEGKKWLYTVLLGLMTFVVTFASSVFSTVTGPTSQEFGVSQEVMILGVSLFVLGFAWGPIIWVRELQHLVLLGLD